MDTMKLTLLSLLASLLTIHCYGEYCSSTDRFYRYSNEKGRFNTVHTGFLAEEEFNKMSKEDPYATYTGTSIPPGINDGYNATPSGRYKNLDDINSIAAQLEAEDTGTYQGTSIPPGINDGYNGTPDGRYKRGGHIFSIDINRSNVNSRTSSTATKK